MDLGGVSCWRLRGRSARAGSNWQADLEREVWIWLNLKGEGMIWGPEDRMFLKPGMYAIIGAAEAERWRWTRLPGEHEAELLVISRPWLARRLGGYREHVHPDFASWLDGEGKLAFAGLMMASEKHLGTSLGQANEHDPASRLRVEALALEWAALRLFRSGRWDEGAGFCQRVGPARAVEKALVLLRQRLAEPLDLGQMGKDCGVSPTHLSRVVKQRTGLTLREHLRRLRVSAAADLLREEGASVTEVAMDVGYQSLSHFAKAFREETGQSPSKWRAQGSGRGRPVTASH